jgi:thioredoxin 1
MTKDDLVSVDDASFEPTLRTHKGRFLLDVTAQWCGPCRAMMPAIVALASERKQTLTVGLLDVDAAPETAIALGIRGAPTLILFEDGKEIARHLGAASPTILRNLVDRQVAA